MKCNVCNSDSTPLEIVKILNQHEVQYYSCNQCGFIQTETPYWLAEAYSSAISRSDIGLIGRNIKLANFCSAVIPLFYDRHGMFLDYGGGNGMFVRMMRDKGFDFRWMDRYSKNQFAEGFEASAEQEYTLVTAFEVFEHLPQPLEVIDDMLSYSDTIVFSTRLLPHWKITSNNWWYFTPDTGQHVSLYSKEALLVIAKKFNVRLSSNGVSLHILSSRSIPSILLKVFSYLPLATITDAVLSVFRKSLLEDDYHDLTGRKFV